MNHQLTDENVQGLLDPLVHIPQNVSTTSLTSVQVSPSWRSSDPKYTTSTDSKDTYIGELYGVTKGKGFDLVTTSEREREELAYQLLASLPRSKLAGIQRRIAPLLQFDLVASLPPEISLIILRQLPAPCLLVCSLVCRRWNILANDSALWRRLCDHRGWKWKSEAAAPLINANTMKVKDSPPSHREDRDEDEGMGDEEESEDEGSGADITEMTEIPFDPEMDSGFGSIVGDETNMEDILPPSDFVSPSASNLHQMQRSESASTSRSVTRSYQSVKHIPAALRPDYKLLHQTHTLMSNRVRRGEYRLRVLPGAEGGGHTAAVYCLWLWTYSGSSQDSSPRQVLFTGSKDRTVREWDLCTGQVRRVIEGIHQSSVLSLCVASSRNQPSTGEERDTGAQSGDEDLLVSGGSDRRVVIWDLGKDKLVSVLWDHEDSVLCVRVDGGRLATCSKDRTIRTYAFPSLKRQYVFRAHRAAVNAVSLAGDILVSASGDRSVRVWDARTGSLMSTFEDHHGRGIASIEYKPPFLLSGSSDSHLRMFDVTTSQGWSTCPEFDHPATGSPSQPVNTGTTTNTGAGGTPSSITGPMSSLHLHSSLSQSLSDPAHSGHVQSAVVCSMCRAITTVSARRQERHTHLVRSVALGDEFAFSGSYDLSIKVWDRNTGALVTDLTGGHTGRIFCIGFDCTKIVSCGEDQRICIWDFSHGIDTSFINL
ncbi:WD40-repeat-containing domain protein [Hygrophoropsis aurantiaca]|uniref:WD40-repeat-containing domain protein n=1 Tax=Hygrophoropsis aurantiaca TaxID=72124 RepID=A0ACB8A9B5_9AGAM|nr:WD40-repeat-containing domain protein [Hygrophoropsis aurantiaca]